MALTMLWTRQYLMYIVASNYPNNSRHRYYSDLYFTPKEIEHKERLSDFVKIFSKLLSQTPKLPPPPLVLRNAYKFVEWLEIICIIKNLLYLYNDHSFCDFMTFRVVLARFWVSLLSPPPFHPCPGLPVQRSALPTNFLILKKSPFSTIFAFFCISTRKIFPKERTIMSVYKHKKRNSPSCQEYTVTLRATRICLDKNWGSRLYLDWLHVAFTKRKPTYKLMLGPTLN